MSSSSPLTPDSGSELSDLSDVESAELEKKLFASKPKGSLDAWLQMDGASSPPQNKRKREASPPHDYILADNPDIAFIVMFRARFASAFPRFVFHFGPQDLENAVVGSPPGELAEKLLCALLGLTLNRKKDIAVGSYNKALEEAISFNKHQWPSTWTKNPMTGGTNFHNMTPEQRLDFLKALCLWALNSSDEIQATIKESYKQSRHDDDLNQPLSVQPWGRDGDKRRYWLVEGQEDTYFRLYRESNPALKTSTWWSVAGSIEEIRDFSEKLAAEGTQASKRLSDRINAAIPRFEAGEDKRKRREYRVNRKMQFARPEPGFSLYEGRTRGKRQRYTFSDDEDGTSDAYSNRRSTRNPTPAEPSGPVITASGRQVRSRLGGAYGEKLHAGQNGRTTESPGLDTDGDAANGRTRSGRGPMARTSKSRGYESDEESDAVSSGNEWQGNDDEEEADDESEGDVDMDDDDDPQGEDDGLPKSLVVKLKLGASQNSIVTGLANGVGQISLPRPVKVEAPAATQSNTYAQNEGRPSGMSPSKLSVGLSRPDGISSATYVATSNGPASQYPNATPNGSSVPHPLQSGTSPSITGEIRPVPTPEVNMTG